MESEGTVAIVRSLPGAALTVTLVDSGRQYTLLPESFTHPASKSRAHGCQTSGFQSVSDVSRRESGVQATDGRYASTYQIKSTLQQTQGKEISNFIAGVSSKVTSANRLDKIKKVALDVKEILMHCHCTPTSPVTQVTEFPPQRAEVCPGHDNFEVGGAGSGECFFHPTKGSGFRGGMIWPDRGSVFNPQPSAQPDSFATSLRKYPSLTQDRSSEIVERLISFTQNKNSVKNKNNDSSTRNISSMSNQTYRLRANSTRSVKYNRGYETQVHVTPNRLQESPTRERSRNVSPEQDTLESWRRSTFSKTNDVRYLKDISRKLKDGIRSLSGQAKNNQPERLNLRERNGSTCSQTKSMHRNTNTVNMETQAAVQMISRDVITLPRVVPSQRTIAVPLTPTPSNIEDQVKENSHIINLLDKEQINVSSQCIFTNLVPTDITVQTVISNTIINNRIKDKRRFRRSKSEEEVKRFTNLKTITKCDASCARVRSYHKAHKYNRSLRTLIKLLKNFESYSNCEEVKSISRISSIFYAKVTKNKLIDENNLTLILKDWINLIPLKILKSHEKQIAKEYLFYDLYDFLQKTNFIIPQLGKRDILKNNIINRLELFPLEIKGNKKIILHRLTDILINKITYCCHKIDNYKNIRNTKSGDIQTAYNSIFQRFIIPTENEVKKFVSKEIESIKQKIGFMKEEQQDKEIEEDLVDIIMISMEEIRSGCDKHVKNDIAELLFDYGLTEQRAFCYAYIFMRHLKETFMNDMYPGNISSETLVVLPSLQNSYNHRSNINESDFTIKSITEEDMAANLEQYTNELCRQIDEWLSTLRIPQVQDKGVKKVIVHDLAGDIIDRHKYLELNPDSIVSEETELEHLKYQIFRWINKLTGEDSLEPMDHASDLMNRIRQVPRPMLFRPDGKNVMNSINQAQEFTGPQSDAMNNTFFSIPEYATNKQAELNVSTSNNIPSFGQEYHVPKNIQELNCPDASIITNISKTTENLEAEYEQFVKDWVQKIPIEASSQIEIDIVEKARLGIHNGLWKVVSKLNCDPTTYYNRFLYEDLLDDAIDDLLDCLPQTTELQERRNRLKVEFIEKTVNVNDRIKNTEEAPFRKSLMKNIITSLRQQGLTENKNDDPIKLHEDLQIIKMVEEYLLSVRFRNDDKMKSEVYKKKLFKEVEDFVNDLKKNHAKELKDIDVTTYRVDIINILQNVPIPNENTIKQEADDVLLGIEIEEWYNNLPIVPNNDYTEQYQRRRQRDILTKKIKGIEVINTSESSEITGALRNEVSRFLERTPLKERESLNINFMVDELVNRLKNKTSEKTSQSARKVLFQTPNYEEFTKNLPFHSSIIETSNSQKNKILPLQGEVIKSLSDAKTNNEGDSQLKNYNLNESVKQSNFVRHDPTSYLFEEGGSNTSFQETSNQQWLTLEDSREEPSHKEHIQMKTLPLYPNLQPLHISDDQPSVQDYCKNIVTKVNNLENIISQKSTSSQSTSRGIKTDRGILGISQIAGTSGYKPSYFKDNKDSSNIPKSHQSLDPYIQSDIPVQNPSEGDNLVNLKSGIANLSTGPNQNKEYLYTHETKSPYSEKISRAVNTSSDVYEREPIFASTPRQTISPTLPSVPRKKRARLEIADRDAVRRRLSLEDSDKDDIPCRCIERFWNNRQYKGSQYDRYPPYLPIFFPYPYFPFL